MVAADPPVSDSHLRTGGLIAVATLVITAMFVGVLAFLSGDVAGVGGRIPWYLIVAAVGFVVSIVGLENAASGREVLTTAGIVAGASFLVLTLTVEGVVYAYRFPAWVFVSQLVLYFLAAALIGTGVGYWTVRHWRELAGGAGRSGGSSL